MRDKEAIGLLNPLAFVFKRIHSCTSRYRKNRHIISQTLQLTSH